MSENFILADYYEILVTEDCCRRGKPQVVYICSTSILAQTVGTPDPPQASRPTRHQNAGWRKTIVWYSLPVAYQNLGIVARGPRNQSAGRIWWSCPGWPSLRKMEPSYCGRRRAD
jgi:hypothetical protein